MTLNMFFTRSEVVIADMFLENLTLLFIYQYQYELFPQTTLFYFELLIMIMALLTMNVGKPSETDSIKSQISSKTSHGKKDSTKKTPSKTSPATAR